MQWQVLVALVIAIPVILLPVALVWYLNLGGIYHAIQDARWKRKVAREERSKAVAEAQQPLAVATSGKRPAGRGGVVTRR